MQPLHRYAQSDSDWPTADIVVFGDSVSHQAHRGHEWQAVLAARTGLRIVTYDLRRGLFSGRRDDLLVYGYAVRPRLPRAMIERMGCGLANLQRRVELRLGAVFVPLLVPSKYSAYQRYLGAESDAEPGFVTAVLAASGLPGVGLKPALDAAIAAGEQDVYLPNDSHWGPIGHRLTAEAVLRYLVMRGALVPRVDAP